MNGTQRPGLATFGVFLLLCAAAWATFGRALDAPFFFDDHFSLRDNETIRQLWPPSVPLAPPRFIPFSGRPLVNLSAALNFKLTGLQPAGFRATNVLLHAASALLLYLIVRRTLRLPSAGLDAARRDGRLPDLLAFGVALLWTVHPLQTETVCYLTQRTELMVGCFYLATLYSSLRYWQANEAGQRRWLTLAVVTSAAGMASKEVMATAPVIVLLFERTFFRRGFIEALQRSWPLHAGLAATWLLLLYLAMSLPRSDSVGFHLGVSALDWWITQCKVVLMYLKLVVWPWPLSIHHETTYVASGGEACLYVAPVAVMVLGTLYALWRNWPIGFLGAWFFGILSPTLLVPIVTEVAAERRMYLPLAAIAVMVVVGGYRLGLRILGQPLPDAATPDGRRWPAILGTGLLLLVAGCLWAVSFERLAVYRDEESLWRDALATYPNSAKSHLNLGFALMNSNRGAEAIDEFRETLRLDPESHEAHFNWGTVLKNEGRLEEALKHFAQAVEVAPNHFDCRRMCGIVLTELKRYPEAIAQFEQALKIRPDSEVIHYNLGLALRESGQLPEAAQRYAEVLRVAPHDAITRNSYGNTLRMLKRYPEAIAQFNEALRIDPKLRGAYFNLGLTYEAMGEREMAIQQYERSLKLYPGDAECRYALGNALSALGRRQEAADQFHRAVELNPKLAEAWNNLGAMLVELDRPTEAIAKHERAVALAPHSPIMLYNLAVAQDAAGRHSDAVATARHALALAQTQGLAAVAQHISNWLAVRDAASPIAPNSTTNSNN